MPLLLTSLINVTGEFLYPAYCSYKALARRQGGAIAGDAELERWLQYWALVGAWTALEGAVGWILSWLPFYTLIKTAVFLYLAISSTGTPYMYNAFLAPLFAEHEPMIDEFIGSIRGQAGAHARGGVGWVYERVRAMLGQADYLSQAGQQQLGMRPGSFSGGPSGPSTMPQPPTLADPASAGMQHAAGMIQGLASRYLPSALAAVSAAAGGAQATAARGFDVPPPPVPPKFDVHEASPPVPQPPSQLAGSRAFQYASEDVYGSTRVQGGGARARTLDASRTSSDGSLSGASNLGASFTEIRREDVVGADIRLDANRRTSSSSWVPWGGQATPKPTDKTQ
ncbi:uncharacterized protein CcaverHIS019_0310570 [Cutaneotrichosporon cavernicola]|uniref:Protein YOP1 n=1 Tax=Cutaneotrichosporon cavernicola TaxID=279322 RepID=A0AA48L2Y3_9TREE|nr:uncharacterized protein CcaverHIS019_0310570 [Cutaneotrichosporon cavernicola]BEI90987.1 hypothetical protein CcaverHIS019_0310570 [Cutaneotrichosporon cavernicola]BEI98765.1 hypothetical protein CcaverHIS631_0310640 [Cutaneotrichosporon cavernicola]BEJ06537.1 hypothetical protein CcaverHIS641_0310590 [Cutaneotrichosporon cavernicola]